MKGPRRRRLVVGVIVADPGADIAPVIDQAIDGLEPGLTICRGSHAVPRAALVSAWKSVYETVKFPVPGPVEEGAKLGMRVNKNRSIGIL